MGDNGMMPEEARTKSNLSNQASTPDAGPVTAPLIDAKAFILAGKAIFTIIGLSNRYTFKVQRREADGNRYQQDAYFVSLLTGPENTSDYTYLGMLEPISGHVRLTRKSSYRDDSTPVKAIRWAVERIWRNQPIPAPAAIMHAGRCRRCGRLLTVPASIVSGFGPECAGRLE